MTFIDTRSSGISSYSRNIASSTHRASDINSGVIKLNNHSIRINDGDTLQTIVSKINRCSSFTGVRASVVTERGRQIIALSSSGQITIVDSNNILNNIGVRIRPNQLQSHQLLYGLVLTELAATKSSSNRYGNYGNPEPRAIPYIEAERIELCEAISDVESSDSETFSDGGSRYYAASPDGSPVKEIDITDQRKDSIAIGEEYKKSIQPPDKKTKLRLKQTDKDIRQMLRAGKLQENDSTKLNIQPNKKKLLSRGDPISPLKHGTSKEFSSMRHHLLRLPNIDQIAKSYGLSGHMIEELPFMDIKELVARNLLFTELRENKDKKEKIQIKIIKNFCENNKQHRTTRLFKDHKQILEEAKHPKTYDNIAKMVNFYKLCYDHLPLQKDTPDKRYIQEIMSASVSSYKLRTSQFK